MLAGGVALFPAAQLCAALLGGGPLTAPEGPSREVAAHMYVVQPGDTLWSIAGRVRPGTDPRPLVQALTSELGGAGLRPGESLQLP
ncbi:MAG TPA: LysM peptidoglycan-binding domain-containing protein [Acidimicrobiales bacterium]|nr:LysM peptidoglycan-binding domain-containing protein [Acidimicrobiales bacterium]